MARLNADPRLFVIGCLGCCLFVLLPVRWSSSGVGSVGSVGSWTGRSAWCVVVGVRHDDEGQLTVDDPKMVVVDTVSLR